VADAQPFISILVDFKIIRKQAEAPFSSWSGTALQHTQCWLNVQDNGMAGKLKRFNFRREVVFFFIFFLVLTGSLYICGGIGSKQETLYPSW
jgi:hypothetical protein